MGVTIHYRLRSKAPDAEQARDVVDRLRNGALDLSFESVGELIELTADHCDFERRDGDCPYWWLLLQTQRLVNDPLESVCRYHITPLHVIAFSCWPGPGCEQANFGLCRYPEVIEVGGQDNQAPRPVETGLRDWSWASFCKTGHARNRECGETPNFGCGHWAIVDVLQHAQTLGILHDVHDEAGYWTSRQILAQALGLACANA
jgi:hypothetical protein